MRTWIFAERNRKEILRDPLSFVFCLGFPIVLLAVFCVIEKNSGGQWMNMGDLIGGVCIFSLSFVMLNTTLLVGKDRASAFSVRLRISPMRSLDFVAGYILPSVVMGWMQSIICLLGGVLTLWISGNDLTGQGAVFTQTVTDWSTGAPTLSTQTITLPWLGILTASLVAIPTALLFAAIGVSFGNLLSERAAPGLCSAVITGAGMLSGAWMPLENMGHFETVCKWLPFYPAVRLCRSAMLLNAPDIADILILLGYTALLTVLSCFAVKKS